MYVVILHVVGAVALTATYWGTLVRGSTTPYVDSPLWLDLPFVHGVIALQVVSFVCLSIWATVMRNTTSARVYGAFSGYYAFSLLWPVLAKRFLANPRPARALLASAPLWGAAVCVLLLLGASPDASTRLLMVPIVVLAVVCDAVLWTVAALRKSGR